MTQQHIKDAVEQQKKYADKYRRELTLHIDDLVYLSAAHIIAPDQRGRPTRKLQPRYLGPFKIIDIINPVAYKLELPKEYRIHNVFHISLLKKYHPNDLQKFPERTTALAQPQEINGAPEWEVEKILDQKIIRNRSKSHTEYLIKWKDYPRMGCNMGT